MGGIKICLFHYCNYYTATLREIGITQFSILQGPSGCN